MAGTRFAIAKLEPYLPSLRFCLSNQRWIVALSPDLQHEIVRRARDLLSDKRKWTRYGAARTGNGAVCPPYSPVAVKFCAYGAIARAALEVTGNRQQACRLARSIERLLVGGERAAQPHSRLCQVNDQKGYAAIICLLDAAVNHRPEDDHPAPVPLRIDG